MALGNGLPDVPDPTKVANSFAEGAKMTFDKATVIGQSIVTCATDIALNTVRGMMATADHVAKDVVSGAEADVATVRSTSERIKTALQSTAEGLRAQVDEGIGGEVVRKFKREFEKVFR